MVRDLELGQAGAIMIAVTIPDVPVVPFIFKIIVEIRSVAIAIPDTGLLELPTRPTILEETVAKKNPNTIMISTLPIPIGMVGTATRIAITISRIIPRNFISRSLF